MNNIELIVSENRRRNEQMCMRSKFDPITGYGAPGPRVAVKAPEGGTVWIPQSMTEDTDYGKAHGDVVMFEQLRLRHDFAYWCARCVHVRHKTEGKIMPLILNAPQRRVSALMEECRLAGQPLRLTMLKARQWGGSTLMQMYYAWIQTVHRRNFHSLICAHQLDTSVVIRDIYSTMLNHYPEQLWLGDGQPGLKACHGSRNRYEITGRECTVALGTSLRPDSLRGHDVQLAHLSEVAFWGDTPLCSPEDLIRTVCGTVPMLPLTAVVLESTANGVGNFFHDLWLKAVEGESAFRPVFVPWYEIEMYRSEPLDPERAAALAADLTEREQHLWQQGLTLEQIAWHRAKRREYSSDAAMDAEFPSTPAAAFASTGTPVIDPTHIERMRHHCRPPLLRGDISGRTLTGPGALEHVVPVESSRGPLEIFEYPSPDAVAGDYLTVVDIGGRSIDSDWSVIAVLRRCGQDGLPEIVAQWRGHEDHDIVGWKAAAIARYYRNALLVIESNTLESAADDASVYILTSLSDHYPNLYMRRDPNSGREGCKPGFHTNRRTKQAVITALVAAVRDGAYVERCPEALNEMITYQRLSNGGYGAKRGHHDDILMTRSIGLYIHQTTPLPRPSSPSTPPPTHLPIPGW